MRRPLPLAGALLLAGTLVAPAAAQPAPAPYPGAREAALARAEALYAGRKPEEAMEVLEERLAAAPDDYQARWQAARAALSAGLLLETEEEQNPRFRRGIAHGEAATALDPEGVEGIYWLLANTGRLAFTLPPRATADAAQEIYLLSHRILALDSLHAGAWNALGKLNFEVMRLSAFERFLARLFLGNDALRLTSWENALAYNARAVELDPTDPSFRLDLGVVHLFRERYEEAARELQLALDLPLRHPGDVLYQREAAGLLPFARERRKP